MQKHVFEKSKEIFSSQASPRGLQVLPSGLKGEENQSVHFGWYNTFLSKIVNLFFVFEATLDSFSKFPAVFLNCSSIIKNKEEKW